MEKQAVFFIIVTLIVVTVVLNLGFFRRATLNQAESFEVTLWVHCDVLLENMDMLDRDRHELVPEDGIIFPMTVVRAYYGDSVFDVLQREMRNSGIHMVSRMMPVYNLAFVEAINNIFMSDAGSMSGWQFRVNGESGSLGASQQILQTGDIIEWFFTLDFSEDW